jgi:hypothetical protein
MLCGIGLKYLFFHLNHPIQYVDLVAPIVAIEPLAQKYALLTIDDGSGATIGVKITRLQDPDPNALDHDEAPTMSTVDCPSNTTVANVNIHVGLGKFEVEIDDVTLDIGTVLRAKCTVSTWFGAKQLDLQRASVVKTTRREVESWREIARFKRDVLSKPWVVSEKERKRLEAEWHEEQNAERLQRTRWDEHQRRKEERERKQEAANEIARREQERIMNEGALI